MVAARSDDQLREAVKPAVQRFEGAIMQTAESLLGRPDEERRFGTLLLSLLHMFDSEATTAVIFETEDVERIRHDWAIDLLRQALLQRDEPAV